MITSVNYCIQQGCTSLCWGLAKGVDAFWFSSLQEEPQGVPFLLPSLHAHTKHAFLNKISGIIYNIYNSQNVHNSFRAT